MDVIVQRLVKIKKKVEVLKSQNEVFSKENKKISKEIQRLNKLVNIQNSSINELEKKLKIQEIVEGVITSEGLEPNKRRELKHKLNEMIREVDKVIAIISK